MDALYTDPNKLLISNVGILEIFVPIPSGLTEVLKEGMFNVPNKRAFSEVVHFLLSLLSPEKCKELVVWPCLNKKDELKFRIGVNKLVTEISETSECTLVRPLNPSLMIAPVGPQVTEYLWKLSLYTLCVVAEKHLGITLPHYVDPSTMHPMIKKARLKAVIEAPFFSKADKIKNKLLEHKQYVDWSTKELRKLEAELHTSENEIINAKMQLKAMVEELDVEQNLKSKLKNENRIEDGLEEWTAKICDELNDLASSVQVLMNFNNEIGFSYEMLKDCLDEKRKVKLDGRALKVSVPSAVENQVVLYKNNDLILENLLEIGLQVPGIIQQRLAMIDLSDFLHHLPIVSALKSDMSLCVTDFSRLFYDLYQFRSSILQSINAQKYSSESGVYSPLTRFAQTPTCALNNFNKSLSVIGVRQKKGEEGRFSKLIIKRKDEKNKTVEKSDTQQKIVSRLKQPKKITLYGSRSEVSKCLRFPETNSVKKCDSPVKNACFLKTVNKENITPKKSVDKLSYKSSYTPDRKTPNRRNIQKSMISETTSKLPRMSPSSSYVPSKKVDNAFINELQESELQNLSKETLPSDTDSDEPVSPVVSSAAVSTQKPEGVHSPSGVVDSSQKRKKTNFASRPSVEALINKFYSIKQKQNDDPAIEILSKNKIIFSGHY